MTRKTIILAILALCVASFAACGDKTELGWINSNGSDGAIKDIKWLDTSSNPEQTWNDDTELAKGQQSDTKEVQATTGRMECLVEDTEFVAADVEIDYDGDGNTDGPNGTLAEGSTNIFTASVLVSAKK